MSHLKSRFTHSFISTCSSDRARALTLSLSLLGFVSTAIAGNPSPALHQRTEQRAQQSEQKGITFETNPAPIRPIVLTVTDRPSAFSDYNLAATNYGVAGYTINVNGAARLRIYSNFSSRVPRYTYLNTTGTLSVHENFTMPEYTRLLNMLRRASSHCPVLIHLDVSYVDQTPRAKIQRVQETCDHLSQVETPQSEG
ncbi:MAG TPA: hypothetical protein PLZ57_07265 [Pseudobdellovibrionaceae bacterium]|nr:hypothetical protein [Pseudobdellovibrionaceae bacterium]